MDDSDRSKTDFPREPAVVSLAVASTELVLPDGKDLREKGINSAAFGFKVIALFGEFSFVSVGDPPFFDKLIIN
ncbi:hypothetical protein A2U01_0059372 [Trifolium medium]|uniref:Uncharacterized protein n=1 Tax=Trifolium medium TaxID=97028 RepID=A0A392RPW7_9FABA|nr:hypothetical protein [Trifolium medium]